MFEEQYVRLRAPDLLSGDYAFESFDPMDGSSAGPGVAVETLTLNPRERRDVQRDPRTTALAPAMPMKLIEPVAAEAEPEAAAAPIAWGVAAVRAPDSPYDGQGITVAVLDTGIDPTHPAFAGIDLVRRNFTEESDDDLNGHGTHCAGTIFGQDVDGQRIGIARHVRRAVIGKVLGVGGDSSLTIVEAIQWALAEGAQVISMSLGIDFPGYVDRLVKLGFDVLPATSRALEGYRANINLFSRLADLIAARRLVGAGALLIAAAGNESDRPRYEIAVAPPAAGTGIVAVGALGQMGRGLDVASFSNSGVSIAAPGVAIRSAVPRGGLRAMSGTSMAAPHVAGVAALWAQKQLEEDGAIDDELLKSRLLASGTRARLAPEIDPDDIGAGLVQAPLG